MKRVLAAVLVVAGLTASAVMASVEDEIRHVMSWDRDVQIVTNSIWQADGTAEGILGPKEIDNLDPVGVSLVGVSHVIESVFEQTVQRRRASRIKRFRLLACFQQSHLLPVNGDFILVKL